MARVRVLSEEVRAGEGAARTSPGSSVVPIRIRVSFDVPDSELVYAAIAAIDSASDLHARVVGASIRGGGLNEAAGSVNVTLTIDTAVAIGGAGHGDWAPIPSSQAPGHGRGMPVSVKAAKTSVGAVAPAVVVGAAIVLWPLAAGSERVDGLPRNRVSVIETTRSRAHTTAGLVPVARVNSARRTCSQRVVGRGERCSGRGLEPPVATQDDGSGTGADRTRHRRRTRGAGRVGGGGRGDVQKSFRRLVLRAIHSDRSGGLVAAIDFAGRRPAASLRVGPGDMFTEPKEADWSVVAIDPDRNRVVLERKDRRVALRCSGPGRLTFRRWLSRAVSRSLRRLT